MSRIAFPRRALSAIVLVCLVGLLSPAYQAQDSAKYKKIVTIEGITEYQLDNGLRFLLFPDPASSTVTVNMTIFVGSRHEGYGETGMAHLLEHMLFKGSKDFPSPDKSLNDHGADFNGTTWVDRTNYYETMNATDENLRFGIHLEADRLINCFIKREDLATEMTVVRNEFEQGENDPESILSQRMMAIAYEWHNYGKSTIGNRTDIERVPIDRLQGFYKKHYQPDNAMLVIAGKFDEKKAFEYITKHFSPIPRPKRVLDKTYTEEPVQDGERLVTLRRVGKIGVVGVIYHLPAGAHEDFPAIDMLDSILTLQPSGRLYKALVETKKATRVSSSAYGWHDPGVLEVLVRVGDKTSHDEIRDILFEQLEKLTTNPVTDEEVERVKRRYLSDRERSLAKSKQIALELSEWAGTGDWRLLFLHRDRVAKVTASDVNRVAAKYLRASNRTLGMFYPTPAKEIARAIIPEAPAVADLVKNYKGGDSVAMGEAFDPTPENLEKRTQRLTLPNGLKVVLLPKKTRGETVVGMLNLNFGNEKSLVPHVSAVRYLGPLMARGTKKHDRQQINDLLDKLGSKLNGSSGLGSLSFSLESKRKNLSAVLDLMKEMAREPSFPEKEFDVLKRNEKQRLEKGLTDPQFLAFNTITRKLHPYPPTDVRYKPSIAEALERQEKVTLAQLESLYHEQIGGMNGEFVLIGDFEPDAAIKQIEGVVANWQAKVPYQRIAQTAKTDLPASREDILTPDKEGATYVAAHLLAMKEGHPDFPALTMGNYILGGSSASRLFDRLRQKEGLSYGAGSQISADAQDEYGMFMMYAICNPANLEKADKAAIEELHKVHKKGVTPEEFAAGLKGYLQELKLEFASDSRLSGTMQEDLFLGRTFKYHAEWEKKISALTVDGINRAMSTHLAPQRILIVRAGDLEKAKQK